LVWVRIFIKVRAITASAYIFLTVLRVGAASILKPSAAK
jgi:hypothetical protein